MPIKLRPIDKIADKYAKNAGAAGPDYAEGVANPKRDQSAAAVAAAPAWADGVQAAITEGRFQKAMQQAGSSKWVRKASTVGAQRYPDGVRQAKGDFQTGARPYMDTIAGLELPPRFPKGDARNLDRVSAVTTALRAQKIAS